LHRFPKKAAAATAWCLSTTDGDAKTGGQRDGCGPTLRLQVIADIGAVPSARERAVLLSGDSRSGNIVLDGWMERDTRATVIFGRYFEKALAAYFRGEDCTAVLFKEWERTAIRHSTMARDSWDRLVHQGVR
jgi:hypothetical protein